MRLRDELSKTILQVDVALEESGQPVLLDKTDPLLLIQCLKNISIEPQMRRKKAVTAFI